MGIEIERKFLVDVEKLINSGALVAPDEIKQAYLSVAPAVRIRIVSSGCCSQAFLTVKGKGKLIRPEFEYSVPIDDASEMMVIAGERTVHKLRYRVLVGSNVWEVDKFLGKLRGLWVAEIELQDPNEEFEKPSWILDEVTNDKRYSNARLAERGWVV